MLPGETGRDKQTRVTQPMQWKLAEFRKLLDSPEK